MTMPHLDEMQRVFRDRDTAYDGVFYVGVRTTGIFCRPSCPARKPKPENTEFFPGPREALFAGYRPCLRCRPMSASGELPAWVSGLLDTIEADPTARLKDADLLARGIEPTTARRFFLKRFGMTFHAYHRSRRLSRAFDAIRGGEPLDDVILGHGFESHSGFREAFVRRFGKPPGRCRGEDLIRVSWVDTPLGPMVAGATGKGLCLLEFTDRPMLETQFATLRRRFGLEIVPGDSPVLASLQTELSGYFDGRLRAFSLPLDCPGTPFQKRVWDELLRIPYGETRAYEDLASSLGNSRAVRAVGIANGMNRIAIVIPCHRVVNKDGQLGGYGGGLWRKRRLLDMERGGSTRESGRDRRQNRRKWEALKD